MLQKEQWLEVEAMEFDFNNDFNSIQISAIEVDQLLLEARERIMEKARLDEKYRELYKQVSSGGNINKSFSISNELLCWKNRIYVPEGLRQQVIQSEHDSKVPGHFGRERTLQLVTRNVN
jgi:archaellum component FlaC